MDKSVHFNENSISTLLASKMNSIMEPVDIIVCIHNALDDVKACIESIEKLTYPNIKLILVDDGSDKDTENYVRAYAERNPWVLTARNETAQGYTKAANIGVSLATSDFLLLLNSDTIVPSGLLQNLILYFDFFPDVGLVGPLSNAASWQSVPDLFDLEGKMKVNDLPLDVSLDQLNETLYRKWVYRPSFPRVPILNGFCMAIRKSVFQKIGDFDELTFPMGYGEENDFCLRAGDAGFGLMVATNAYVYHAKSKSYSHGRREILSNAGYAALIQKYSRTRLERAVASCQMNPILRHVRSAFSDMFFGKGRKDAPIPPESSLVENRPEGRIAVVVHLYYAELWSEIAGYLAHFPEPFDLFISLTAGRSEHLEEVIKSRFESARVLVFPNRGRDILPFMFMLKTDVFAKYEVVLKIHGKKSSHSANGDQWRKSILESLIGTPERIRAAIDAISSPTNVGIIGPDASVSGSKSWGGNRIRAAELIEAWESDLDLNDLQFVAGSMMWIHPLVIRMLKMLDVNLDGFEDEAGQLDNTLAHVLERTIGLAAQASDFDIIEAANVERLQRVKPALSNVLAFYLPQFHPVEENNRWWGEGFTEWTNVVKAKPSFEGHRQPRLPADLGFYDLRLPEARLAQAKLAKKFGVNGFCYYYYWFNGKRMLNRPLDDVLASGEPDFPFCICWANETWSRRWDGRENEVLIKQDYTADFAERFIKDVMPLLKDPRYIKYDNAPFIAVYRLGQIPNYREVIDIWRRICSENGIPRIHVAAVRVPKHFEYLEDAPSTHNLDSYISFPPHLIDRKPINERVENLASDFSGCIVDYDKAIKDDERNHASVDGLTHRGIMMGWDNTPRRGNAALIFHGSNPGKFRRWLRNIQKQQLQSERMDSILFVNAWNEWAEGTTLEPDSVFGLGYLEAVKSVFGVRSDSDD